jgi:hypothetical protein
MNIYGHKRFFKLLLCDVKADYSMEQTMLKLVVALALASCCLHGTGELNVIVLKTLLSLVKAYEMQEVIEAMNVLNRFNRLHGGN